MGLYQYIINCGIPTNTNKNKEGTIVGIYTLVAHDSWNVLKRLKMFNVFFKLVGSY